MKNIQSIITLLLVCIGFSAQAATFSVSSLSSLQAGTTGSIAYSASGFSSGNHFKLEMYTMAGSLRNRLFDVTATTGSTQYFNVPGKTDISVPYVLKMVTTNPANTYIIDTLTIEALVKILGFSYPNEPGRTPKLIPQSMGLAVEIFPAGNYMEDSITGGNNGYTFGLQVKDSTGTYQTLNDFAFAVSDLVVFGPPVQYVYPLEFQYPDLLLDGNGDYNAFKKFKNMLVDARLIFTPNAHAPVTRYTQPAKILFENRDIRANTQSWCAGDSVKIHTPVSIIPYVQDGFGIMEGHYEHAWYRNDTLLSSTDSLVYAKKPGRYRHETRFFPDFVLDEIESFIVGFPIFWQVNYPITLSSSISSPQRAGNSFNLPFSKTCTYNSGNTFTALLSDSLGDFSAPLSIGTLTSTSSGNIPVTIPDTIWQGSGYRVRIVSSNPASYSDTSNAFAIVLFEMDSLEVISGLNHDTGNHYISCGINPIRVLPRGSHPYGWVLRETSVSAPFDTVFTDTITLDTTGLSSIYVAPALEPGCLLTVAGKGITWSYRYYPFDSLSVTSVSGPINRIGNVVYVTPGTNFLVTAHGNHGVAPPSGTFNCYRNESLVSSQGDSIPFFGDIELADTTRYYFTFESAEGCITQSEEVTVISETLGTLQALVPVSGLNDDTGSHYYACLGTPIVLLAYGEGIAKLEIGSAPGTPLDTIAGDTLVIDPGAMDSLYVRVLTPHNLADTTQKFIAWHTYATPSITALTALTGAVDLPGDTVAICPTTPASLFSIVTDTTADTYHVVTQDDTGSSVSVDWQHHADASPFTETITLNDPRTLLQVTASWHGCVSAPAVERTIILDTLEAAALAIVPISGFGATTYTFGDTVFYNYRYDSLSGNYYVPDTSDFQLFAQTDSALTDSLVWTIDEIGYRVVTAGPVLPNPPKSEHARIIRVALKQGPFTAQEAAIGYLTGTPPAPADVPHNTLSTHRQCLVRNMIGNDGLCGGGQGWFNKQVGSVINSIRFNNHEFIPAHSLGIGCVEDHLRAATQPSMAPGLMFTGLGGQITASTYNCHGFNYLHRGYATNGRDYLENYLSNRVLPNISNTRLTRLFQSYASGVMTFLYSDPGAAGTGCLQTLAAARAQNTTNYVAVNWTSPENPEDVEDANGNIRYSVMDASLEVLHRNPAGGTIRIDETRFHYFRLNFPMNNLQGVPATGQRRCALPGEPYMLVRGRQTPDAAEYIVVAFVKRNTTDGYFGLSNDNATQSNGSFRNSYSVFYSWAAPYEDGSFPQVNSAFTTNAFGEQSLSRNLEIRVFHAPVDDEGFQRKVADVMSDLDWAEYNMLENPGDLLTLKSPIAVDFIADQHNGTNLRGYETEDHADMPPPADDDFFDGMIERIDNTAENALRLGSQGLIIWDLEGGQNNNANVCETGWVGDPRLAESVAPELSYVKTTGGLSLVDAMFDRLVNHHHLIPGITIRGQKLQWRDMGASLTELLADGDADGPAYVPYDLGTDQARRDNNVLIATMLAQKMFYAYQRWGVRIFYIDAPVGEDLSSANRAGVAGLAGRGAGLCPFDPEIFEMAYNLYKGYFTTPFDDGDDEYDGLTYTVGNTRAYEPILMIPELPGLVSTGAENQAISIRGLQYYAYTTPYFQYVGLAGSTGGFEMKPGIKRLYPGATNFVRYNLEGPGNNANPNNIDQHRSMIRREIGACQQIPGIHTHRGETDNSDFRYFLNHFYGPTAPYLPTGCVTQGVGDILTMGSSYTSLCGRVYTDAQGLANYDDATASPYFIEQGLAPTSADNATTTQKLFAVRLDPGLNRLAFDPGNTDSDDEDRLEFINDDGTTRTLLATAKGENFPPIITSTGSNELVYKFTTDQTTGTLTEEIGWQYKLDCRPDNQMIITDFHVKGQPWTTKTCETPCTLEVKGVNFNTSSPSTTRIRFDNPKANSDAASICVGGPNSGNTATLMEFVVPTTVVLPSRFGIHNQSGATVGNCTTWNEAVAWSAEPFVPMHRNAFHVQRGNPDCNAILCSVVEADHQNYIDFYHPYLRWFRIAGQCTLSATGLVTGIVDPGEDGIFRQDGRRHQYVYLHGLGEFEIASWVNNNSVQLYNTDDLVAGTYDVSVGGNERHEGLEALIEMPGDYWVRDHNSAVLTDPDDAKSEILHITAADIAPCGLTFGPARTVATMSGASNALRTGEQSFTLQFYFRQTSRAGRQLLFTNSGVDTRGVRIVLDNGTLGVAAGGTGASICTNRTDRVELRYEGIEVGAVYHVSLIRERDGATDNLRLYVRPISLHSEELAKPNNEVAVLANVRIDHDNRFRFGGSGSLSFIGQISDVRFWTRSFTNEEIENGDFRIGLPLSGEEPDLAAYWRMRERISGNLDGSLVMRTTPFNNPINVPYVIATGGIPSTTGASMDLTSCSMARPYDAGEELFFTPGSDIRNLFCTTITLGTTVSPSGSAAPYLPTAWSTSVNPTTLPDGNSLFGYNVEADHCDPGTGLHDYYRKVVMPTLELLDPAYTDDPNITRISFMKEHNYEVQGLVDGMSMGYSWSREEYPGGTATDVAIDCPATGSCVTLPYAFTSAHFGPPVNAMRPILPRTIKVHVTNSAEMCPDAERNLSLEVRPWTNVYYTVRQMGREVELRSTPGEAWPNLCENGGDATITLRTIPETAADGFSIIPAYTRFRLPPSWPITNAWTGLGFGSTLVRTFTPPTSAGTITSGFRFNPEYRVNGSTTVWNTLNCSVPACSTRVDCDALHEVSFTVDPPAALGVMSITARDVFENNLWHNPYAEAPWARGQAYVWEYTGTSLSPPYFPTYPVENQFRMLMHSSVADGTYTITTFTGLDGCASGSFNVIGNSGTLLHDDDLTIGGTTFIVGNIYVANQTYGPVGGGGNTLTFSPDSRTYVIPNNNNPDRYGSGIFLPKNESVLIMGAGSSIEGLCNKWYGIDVFGTHAQLRFEGTALSNVKFKDSWWGIDLVNGSLDATYLDYENNIRGIRGSFWEDGSNTNTIDNCRFSYVPSAMAQKLPNSHANHNRMQYGIIAETPVSGLTGLTLTNSVFEGTLNTQAGATTTTLTNFNQLYGSGVNLTNGRFVLEDNRFQNLQTAATFFSSSGSLIPQLKGNRFFQNQTAVSLSSLVSSPGLNVDMSCNLFDPGVVTVDGITIAYDRDNLDGTATGISVLAGDVGEIGRKDGSDYEPGFNLFPVDDPDLRSTWTWPTSGPTLTDIDNATADGWISPDGDITWRSLANATANNYTYVRYKNEFVGTTVATGAGTITKTPDAIFGYTAGDNTNLPDPITSDYEEADCAILAGILFPTKTVGAPKNTTTGVSEDLSKLGNLLQNNPNPTEDLTLISWRINQIYRQARLEVFELGTGRMLLSTDILNDQQSGSSLISTRKLSVGLYGYRLIVDGKQVDVKRMSVMR